MFRKVLAASIAALLVSVTLSVAPASAAVKNGTPCSKAGATTKSGGSTFRCAKYALVKNAKLTWRTLDCIKAVNTYLTANKSFNTTKAETAKTATAVDTAIANLQESITALTPIVAADVKIETDRIATIKVKLDAMKADTVNLVKNAKNIKDYESAISRREFAVRQLNNQITAFTSQVKRLTNSKTAGANNLLLIKSTADTALQTAKTICEN